MPYLPTQLAATIAAPSVDPVIRQIGPDRQGGIATYMASGAVYYVLPNGAWMYSDGSGNEYIGDANGNYCDSQGNCYGAWGETRGIWMLVGAALLLWILFGKK